MDSKVFLALLAFFCIITVINTQSSTANPISSLQQKASSVAASATNTSPAAPSNTGSGGLSLNTGLSDTVLIQLTVLGFAFIATSLLA